LGRFSVDWEGFFGMRMVVMFFKWIALLGDALAGVAIIMNGLLALDGFFVLLDVDFEFTTILMPKSI
jgi:hypothetical protein